MDESPIIFIVCLFLKHLYTELTENVEKLYFQMLKKILCFKNN